MTHLLIGISAALAVCVGTLGVLVVVLVRRAGRRADERVDRVVQTLELRMEDLAAELAGALDRAEEEGRRSRFLGEIAGSIDLDEVLSRTLDAAGGLPGADAAFVRLEPHHGPHPDGGKPVVFTLGLSDEDPDPGAIGGPPDGRDVRSIEVAYGYAEEDDESLGEPPLRTGLAVPLPDDAGRLGYLAIFTRDRERRFDEYDVGRLEELAVRAGPAIENARRFKEARQLADLDALTGLHNQRYFHETLAREITRAHRYDRKLALIVFDLDDFKHVNDRIGHLAGDAVLADAAERIREVVRGADVACRIGGDEFAVVLPESELGDADHLYRRIQDSVSAHPLGAAGRLHLSAGIAELQPGDDAVSFFERADEALYRAKQAGKGQVASA